MTEVHKTLGDSAVFKRRVRDVNIPQLVSQVFLDTEGASSTGFREIGIVVEGKVCKSIFIVRERSLFKL